jgi:hypothetical protein
LPAAQLKYGAALNELLAEYREDFGWDYMKDFSVEQFPALYKAGRNRDAFGTLWHVEWAGICGIPFEWPIADWAQYPTYRWPDANTAATCAASMSGGTRARPGSLISSSFSNCAGWKTS